jgi:hypothetical protein
MTYPHIAIANIPNTSAERYALRERAIVLHTALRDSHASAQSYLLLNYSTPQTQIPPIDCILIRPNSIIIGMLKHYPNAISIMPNGEWIERSNRSSLRDAQQRTPLQVVHMQRDIIRQQLNAAAEHLLGPEAPDFAFQRTIGALICTPSLPAESTISLDIDDHIQQLKILGLNELASLMAMSNNGLKLEETQIRYIITEILGGSHWHDGTRFLFELAAPRYQLRRLGAIGEAEQIHQLIEGETIVGRRRTAKAYEARISIEGDDLISTDHIRIYCDTSNTIRLTDISKNGTWIIHPDHTEQRLHQQQATINPNTILRIGTTLLQVEPIAN